MPVASSCVPVASLRTPVVLPDISLPFTATPLRTVGVVTARTSTPYVFMVMVLPLTVTLVRVVAGRSLMP